MFKHFVTHFCFIIFLRFISCCQCNLNHSDPNIEKRQLEVEEYAATVFVDNITDIPDLKDTSEMTTLASLNFSTPESNETATEANDNTDANKTRTITEQHTALQSIFELNENSSEIIEALIDDVGFESNYLGATGSNETSTTEAGSQMKATEKITNSDLVKKCRHYKNGNYFNLRKMADIWQVVYYRLPNKLKCFKLNIKLVSLKEQKRYARVFGNFNDTIQWNRCYLEITSTEKEHSGRKHFLQGTQNEKGVMENVIIDEEYCQNTTYLTLHRESGDQWLVIDNLLVMRDCENADFVVFGRVPSQPRKDDIMDALAFFGEHNPNGTLACTDSTDQSLLKLDDNVHLHDEETPLK